MIEKAQEKISQAASGLGRKLQDIVENEKIKQLNLNKVDPSPSSSFTANTGMRIGNTDVWLKVSSDEQGPSLLQDHHAREKVPPLLLNILI